MAGSDEHSSTQEPKKPAKKAKSFACSRCGGPCTIRNTQSLSVVCEQCHAIIDTSDENYRILQIYTGKTNLYTPALELGSRCELFGRKWELIGYIVRQEEASGFWWEEYLLFSPYYGYRWLVCADGHWNFVTPIKARPEVSSYNRATCRGKKYYLFNRGQVSNIFVLGEFYWKVQQGMRVEMADYINPPEMLSYEMDRNELTWGLGTYVDRNVILEKFKVKERFLTMPAGIGANQVSKATVAFKSMVRWWMLFLLLLTAMQMGHLVSATNQLALVKTLKFIPNKNETSATTPVFVLDKGSSNVKIQLDAPVSNSWFYFSGELVNNDTGLTFPFDRSVEYYSGSDEDGYWSEGSATASLLIPSVPGGKYYINYDDESGDFKPQTTGILSDNPGQVLPMEFTLRVYRDVPTYANYFWCIFFVSILPCFYWFLSNNDESQRWSNSDFPRSF